MAGSGHNLMLGRGACPVSGKEQEGMCSLKRLSENSLRIGPLTVENENLTTHECGTGPGCAGSRQKSEYPSEGLKCTPAVRALTPGLGV